MVHVCVTRWNRSIDSVKDIKEMLPGSVVECALTIVAVHRDLRQHLTRGTRIEFLCSGSGPLLDGEVDCLLVSLWSCDKSCWWLETYKPKPMYTLILSGAVRTYNSGLAVHVEDLTFRELLGYMKITSELEDEADYSTDRFFE